MARRTLARALRRAVQESWIVRNAARLADGPRSFEDEEEQRCLTTDEAHRLLVTIRTTDLRAQSHCTLHSVCVVVKCLVLRGR